MYVKAGISDRKAALLIMVEATSSTFSPLLACEAGERKQSWCELLRDLKQRRLKLPRLSVAHGHLGIWPALGSLRQATVRVTVNLR